MIESITRINALLVDIKTLNGSLSIKLQKAGFNIAATLGHEDEYTLSNLLSSIDTLAVHFLTITANRNQFIQRTSFAERSDIELHLKDLYQCLRTARNELDVLEKSSLLQIDELTPYFLDEKGERRPLVLCQAVEFVDRLKPYSRMLELVIAQERIHALSSVLEILLHRESAPSSLSHEDDHELTEEQSNALELSHYLIKQAL
jgi:hypothetical protein